MHVAQFSDCYKPVINGVVTSIHLLKRALEDQGHDVSLFAPSYPGYLDPELQLFTFASCWQPFHSDNRAALPWPPRAVRQLRRAPADLVHIHTPFNVGLMGVQKAWRQRVPMVFTHHTLWEEYVHYLGTPEWLGRRITHAIYRFYFSRMAHIIAPSRQVAGRLDALGVRAPVSVIPTGIDASCFRGGDARQARADLGLGEREVLFCFIGRIGEEKSIDVVLECFAQAAREQEDIRLAVVGHGTYLNALRKLAVRLGVGEKVFFPGPRPREELRHLLAASRAFLFASQTETQGLVLLEAAAAGVPICAFRASGVDDAVSQNETGVLLERGDRAGFVRTVLELARRPEWAAQLGDRGSRWVERFSIVAMGRQVSDVYQNVLEENSRGKSLS